MMSCLHSRLCVLPEASLRAFYRYDSDIDHTIQRLIGVVLPCHAFPEPQLPVNAPGPSFGIGQLSAVSCAFAAFISPQTSTKTLVQRLYPNGAFSQLLDDVHFDGAYSDLLRGADRVMCHRFPKYVLRVPNPRSTVVGRPCPKRSIESTGQR